MCQLRACGSFLYYTMRLACLPTFSLEISSHNAIGVIFSLEHMH